MEDGQNTKNRPSTDQNYLSAIGINFPTPSHTVYFQYGESEY